MGTLERIDRILARVLAPIPAPYVPAPKPRASWAKLKVGDTLELHTAWTSQSLGLLQPGARLRVAATDSEGMTLALPLTGRTWRWTNPDWGQAFSKVKAPRPRKPATKHTR